MSKFFIVAIFGIIGIVTLAVIGAQFGTENVSAQAHRNAFITLFKADIPDGKHTFSQLGTRCMEDAAGGELPTYFTEYFNEMIAAPLVFSIENGIYDPKDEAFQIFAAKARTEFEQKNIVFMQKLDQEPDLIKAPMLDAIEFINTDKLGLYPCIGEHLLAQQKRQAPTGN
jgi:hypothetical protein